MSEITLTDPLIRGLVPEKRIEIYDKHTRGLAVRVSPTGYKSFVYRYRYGKDVKRITIGKYPKLNLAQARKLVTELEILLHQGKDPLEEKKKKKYKPKELTIAELANIYIDKHIPTLKKTTQVDYIRRIRIIKSTLGTINVKDLSRNHIISFLEDILEDNEAPIQSNRLRAILSSIYSFGMKRGKVEYNPVLTVKPLAAENSRDRYHTNSEIKIIWERIELEAEPFRSYFKILFLCGQRATETRLAEWSHIKDGVWHIPKLNTKSGKEQNLELSDFAFEVLKQLQVYSGGSQFLFASSLDNGSPISWVQNASKRIRDNCSVDDFRIHDIRTTVMTNMAELGVSRTVIRKILNHAELSGDNHVTAVYDRFNYSKEKKTALQKWANHLKTIIGEN